MRYYFVGFALAVAFAMSIASVTQPNSQPHSQVRSPVMIRSVERITVSEPDLVMAVAEEAARRQQQADIESYLAAVAASAPRQESVQRVAPQSFDYPAECEGHIVPARILWKESHCNYGAVNPSGCGGWSCVGMYQFDLRHWLTPEQGGWGGCAWIGDWTVPANQDACAEQMSRGGTNLSAWGG